MKDSNNFSIHSENMFIVKLVIISIIVVVGGGILFACFA